MTVTMYNKITGVTVTGIRVSYIDSWNKMGFEVISYDSPNICVFNKNIA